MPPKCINDVGAEGFEELLKQIEGAQSTAIALAAYPAEMAREEALEEDHEPLDSIVDDEDIGDDSTEAMIQEKSLLEEMPLPGRTLDEAARKREWLKLPRPARAAIRRMHMQFGHCLKGPLIEILKATKAPDEYIRAAKHFKCDEC